MTISSNTAVYERSFSCVKIEESVLRTRLGVDTLDRNMCININGSFLDNFDAEKFVSDWIDSAVTLKHLNGHNSSRIEIHEKVDENIIVL